MFATGYQTLSVKLELNDLEASWLKNIMQNPLNCKELDDETELDRTMRKDLFKALDEAGVKTV